MPSRHAGPEVRRGVSNEDVRLGGLSPIPASIPRACRVCGGGSWVCENCPDLPWDGMSSQENACGCGAGMPCGACNLVMASAGYVDQREKAIATWLRELPPKYSGWNDHDEVFDRGWNGALEWVADQVATGKHWGAAQAIEARRAAATPCAQGSKP